MVLLPGGSPRASWRLVKMLGGSLCSGVEGAGAWEEKTAMSCASPPSSMVKSSFFKPVTGAPCLSRTVMLTWTMRVVVRITDGLRCCAGAVLDAVCFWGVWERATNAGKERKTREIKAMRLRMRIEPPRFTGIEQERGKVPCGFMARIKR